jgi:hypothetical protein
VAGAPFHFIDIDLISKAIDGMFFRICFGNLYRALHLRPPPHWLRRFTALFAEIFDSANHRFFYLALISSRLSIKLKTLYMRRSSRLIIEPQVRLTPLVKT